MQVRYCIPGLYCMCKPRVQYKYLSNLDYSYYFVRQKTRKPCGIVLQLQKDSKVIHSASVLLSRAMPTSHFRQLCNFQISKSLRFQLTQLDRRPFKKAINTKTIFCLLIESSQMSVFTNAVVSSQCPHFSDFLSRLLVKINRSSLTTKFASVCCVKFLQQHCNRFTK